MDDTVKRAAMQATYMAARDALLSAARAADEAVQATMAGSLNLARGTAVEAETCIETARKLMDAAAAVHRLGQK